MDIVARKVVIVGDQGVGKTSLLLRYTKNTFQESYYATVGADFAMKEEKLDNGRRIQLYLWDLAGNPTFRVMRQYYFQGAHAVIICFALDDPRSFETIKANLKEIGRAGSQNLPVIIAGTKADLVQAIGQAEIDKLCKDEGLPYVRTSAKMGENVHELFLKAATAALLT